MPAWRMPAGDAVFGPAKGSGPTAPSVLLPRNGPNMARPAVPVPVTLCTKPLRIWPPARRSG